ncbi:MAG: DUF3592 domain-containing protein [Gammaproteobacteria bacterium]|nr:DUF3592 domain-containing protein [Gammaproteobacteria bacterium]
MNKSIKYNILLAVAIYGGGITYFHTDIIYLMGNTPYWYYYLFLYAVLVPSAGFWIIVFPILIIRKYLIWYESKFWPIAEGEMIDLKLCEGNYDEVDSWKLLYRYSVDGVDYKSKRFKAGEFLPPTSISNPELYKPGKTVEVHYNPKKPSYGVLVSR